MKAIREKILNGAGAMRKGEQPELVRKGNWKVTINT